MPPTHRPIRSGGLSKDDPQPHVSVIVNAEPPAMLPFVRPSSAKQRIIDAAYELFTRQGTRPVGIDAIIERSGVAKMTLYRHYRSKQDLVLAFLECREERWVHGWLAQQIPLRAPDPRGRLLAVFDLYDEWFQSADFEGCPFVGVLLEYDRDSKIHVAAANHLSNIQALMQKLVAAAGLADVAAFAGIWQMLLTGAVIAAAGGNRAAALEARRAAELVLNAWPTTGSGTG